MLCDIYAWVCGEGVFVEDVAFSGYDEGDSVLWVCDIESSWE